MRVTYPDRADIGGSDPRPGRTIAGYAREVLAQADALDIERFAVRGYYWRGPHALAPLSATEEKHHRDTLRGILDAITQPLPYLVPLHRDGLGHR